MPGEICMLFEIIWYTLSWNMRGEKFWGTKNSHLLWLHWEIWSAYSSIIIFSFRGKKVGWYTKSLRKFSISTQIYIEALLHDTARIIPIFNQLTGYTKRRYKSDRVRASSSTFSNVLNICIWLYENINTYLISLVRPASKTSKLQFGQWMKTSLSYGLSLILKPWRPRTRLSTLLPPPRIWDTFLWSSFSWLYIPSEVFDCAAALF